MSAFDPTGREPISLMELTEETCRWPLDLENGGTGFCGRYCPRDEPYCAEHTAISRVSVNRISCQQEDAA